MRLIDADRLLTDRMKRKYYHLPNGDTAIPIIDIEHAPTIEPERLHGEWELTDNRWGVGTWRCTNCDSYYDVDTNYCPNCGADMRPKEGGERGDKNE